MAHDCEQQKAPRSALENGFHRRPAVGDEVRAQDGTVGRVNRLLRTETALPRFMIVATGTLWRRYPVIACGLITAIEDDVVTVRGSKRQLQRQPEVLPLVV